MTLEFYIRGLSTIYLNISVLNVVNIISFPWMSPGRQSHRRTAAVELPQALQGGSPRGALTSPLLWLTTDLGAIPVSTRYPPAAAVVAPGRKGEDCLPSVTELCPCGSKVSQCCGWGRCCITSSSVLLGFTWPCSREERQK